MYVVATAGHVDHGKSTLVRCLTGMEPDRWAEERRRGMTIDLGFAWTTLSTGRTVAFVDVPGHERFVTNMLAGVGAVPAVMLVVAADEGWMPQTEEHMQAVAALGAPHVLVVVTKTDVAPAATVQGTVEARLTAMGVDAVATVAVSSVTGDGMGRLRNALDTFLAQLPSADRQAPVRLWVDRAFTVRGAGTVVTGTLTAGTVHVGDRLVLAPSGKAVDVRGLQSMQQNQVEVTAPARVALNLRGVGRADVQRGDALISDDAWTITSEVDAVAAHESMPEQVVVHIGAAAVAARLRRLGAGAVRIRTAQPLPLHVGDRLLLRDPVTRKVAGADVAEVAPLRLARRGDAARIAAALRVPADAAEWIGRRGVTTAAAVTAAGLRAAGTGVHRVGEWRVSAAQWDRWRDALDRAVRADAADALSGGVPVTPLCRTLGVPAEEVVVALAAEMPALSIVDGRIRLRDAAPAEIPQLAVLTARLRANPLDAPDAAELHALGLGPRELAHAARLSLVLRLADGVYVGPDAPARAVATLSTLPDAFTVSDARKALSSTRRVVVPLLEHLDATRWTRRLPDGSRVVVRREA